MGSAFLGTVEVDDVEPLAASVLEFFGDVDGVDFVGGLLVVIAATETDDLSVAKIDGWDEFNAHGDCFPFPCE